MVETRAALDEVEAVAAVDQLDLLPIGTNDPCAECGTAGQYGHPLVAEACAHTRRLPAARQARRDRRLAAQPDLL